MKTNSRYRGALSEINVTPLVDVMLVLLIIFMVTAPLMKQGTDIELPQSKGKAMPVEERLEITVGKDGGIKLNDKEMSIKEMRLKLEAISKQNPNVYLMADKSAAYGDVVRVIGEIKDSGIEKLGIVTVPAGKEK